MMSRTFGAPLGGTTRGAHQGVESLALSLMTPPNFEGNGGSCFPSRVVVALGEPGVACWTTDVGPALLVFGISPPIYKDLFFAPASNSASWLIYKTERQESV